MRQLYPKTLLQFEQWFRAEEACRDYLFRLRWPNGFRCPKCAHGQAWQVRRGLWQCGGCGRDVSVTAGTIFESTKLPLRIWFRAIWWVTNQKSGVSALGLQRTLGLGSYETAWMVLHKLRRAMVRPGRELLAGTVEVDETIIGGRVRGRHGQAGRPLVVIAAEVRGKAMGRIRLKQTDHPSRQNLIGFVRQQVAPGSTIISDGAWGYDGLAEFGYVHDPTVLHNKGKQGAGMVLPRVHRVTALLKRWLLGIHQGRVSRKQLGYYLDEFAFRFNRRSSESRGMLFYRLVQQAVTVRPFTYHELIETK